VKANRPLENADIVVWHSFGIHHMPRSEDHPVQNCVVCGFKLIPSGFFDQNPVIDLPPSINEKSCCA
jgi:primary-amine oxidase